MKSTCLFNSLLLSLFVCSLASANNYRKPNYKHTRKIESIYKTAKSATGTADQMAKRALVLLNLYLDSDKNLNFAYAISHLTLAIERSTHTPRLNRVMHWVSEEDTEAWIRWGEGLRNMNREMVRHFLFAYELTKYKIESGAPFDELESSMTKDHILLHYLETKDLYPLFLEVLEAKQNGQALSPHTQKQMAFQFIQWEHSFFLQPRMEHLFSNMTWLIQKALVNVPGRFAESLTSLLKVRTTLSLECFPDDQKLHTKNFMDPENRMDQARSFYKIIESIDFDENYRCYNTQYYHSRLPWFFVDPKPQPKKIEAFARQYYKLVSNISNSGSLQDWLADQYKDIPPAEFADMPSMAIPISKQDRQSLAFIGDRISQSEKENWQLKKNNYINRAYHEIGNELMQCMGDLKMANWYHFAAWASLSGGKVINRSRFDDLSNLKKAGMKFSTAMDWTDKEKIREIFIRANTLIALEMIPLGREFLSRFCTKKNEALFSIRDFINDIGDDELHNKYIKEAFLHYYRAIHLQNSAEKKERITYASTMQVIGEQTRVDDNLDEVFKVDSRLVDWELDWYIRLQSSRSGALRIGDQHALLVPLVKDVSLNYIDEDLKKIELPEYVSLHEQLNIPSNLSFYRRVPKTAARDWSKRKSRYKFLTAMFRAYASHPSLREKPPTLSY